MKIRFWLWNMIFTLILKGETKIGSEHVVFRHRLQMRLWKQTLVFWFLSEILWYHRNFRLLYGVKYSHQRLTSQRRGFQVTSTSWTRVWRLFETDRRSLGDFGVSGNWHCENCSLSAYAVYTTWISLSNLSVKGNDSILSICPRTHHYNLTKWWFTNINR